MFDGKITGNVHSFQSLGAADGPGVRSVVFLQGCPLRCAYCHNPDTWEFSGGEVMSAEQVTDKIKRYKAYFGKEGGVTLSGGEVLMQPAFARQLLKMCKQEGIHTAIDTSGTAPIEYAQQVLGFTDLVICDIKFTSEKDYEKFCGGSLERTLEFLQLCENLDKPFWIRSVILPGINDNQEFVESLVDLVKGFKNLKKIELLPFKKMCMTKYKELNIDFPFKDTDECSKDAIIKLSKFIPNHLK